MKPQRFAGLLAVAALLSGCSDGIVHTGDVQPLTPRANLAPLSGPIDNPFGINVSTFGRGVEETNPAEATAYTNAARVAQAGIGWVRLDFYWSLIQAGGRASFDASREDYQVQRAKDNNLRVLGTLSGIPYWQGTAWKTDAAAWQTFLADWERYVRYVVARYPDVTHWSVWNEPNHPDFWPGTEAQYIDLIRRASPIIRGAGKKVVAPESAASGHWIQFVGRVLNAVGNDIDVVSVHNYKNDTHGELGVEHDIYRLAIEAPVNAAWRWPIWLTEFGPIPYDGRYPGTTGASPNVFDDNFQASHLQRTMDAMASARIPFWERTFYWHMVDEWNERPDGSLEWNLDRGLFAGEREGRLYQNPSLVTPRAAYYQYRSETQNRFAGQNIGYRAHVAYNGWHPEVWNGRVAGMVAQTWTVIRATPEIQAIQVRLNNMSGAGVSYQVALRGGGTLSASNGATAGTVGQGIGVEGIRIWLNNPPANRRVCYRVQRTDGAGWNAPVCDGALAGMVGGTSGVHPTLMAIQIWVANTEPTALPCEPAPGQLTCATR